MVKALVFGTKDLCVRIAPWSLHAQFFWPASRAIVGAKEIDSYERLLAGRERKDWHYSKAAFHQRGYEGSVDARDPAAYPCNVFTSPCAYSLLDCT